MLAVAAGPAFAQTLTKEGCKFYKAQIKETPDFNQGQCIKFANQFS
jgi:hypothetical protein